MIVLSNKEFKVLDDGFVHYIDHMGDDSSIVQAARVSYGKGTKTPSDDRTLIRYLMRHNHTTPFEMCELKLHVRVPMDCWRQWIRHRTASVNEYSTRYSEAIDSQQKTNENAWRMQDKNNKQGSDGFLYDDDRKYLTQKESELHQLSRTLYKERLKYNVAREQARKDLPLSTYTEAYWKINLHNLFHFLQLRMDSHAQQEIREYATIIGNEIVAKLWPLAWEAFQDYRLNAITFSSSEIRVLKSLIKNEWNMGDELSKREQQEFKDKMNKIGIKLG